MTANCWLWWWSPAPGGSFCVFIEKLPLARNQVPIAIYHLRTRLQRSKTKENWEFYDLVKRKIHLTFPRLLWVPHRHEPWGNQSKLYCFTSIYFFCLFVCPACPILCDNLYDQMSKVHHVGSNYLPHLPNYHQQILHDAPNIKSPRGSLKHLFMGWNFSFGRCHGNITFTVVTHCCAAWCRNSKLYITLQT